MEAIIPILVIAGVIVALVFGLQARKAKVRAWGSFAGEHGLRLLNAGSWSNPRIVGSWRGVESTLQIEVHGSGKHRKTYTRASARFRRAMPRGLSVTSEGFTDKLAKMLGGQDIQIGHAELDRQLRIKAEDEVATRVLMKNGRARNAIAAFIARDGRATLTQHQATTLRLGFMSADFELQGMLEGVSRAVREVESALAEPDGERRPGDEDRHAAPTPRPSTPSITELPVEVVEVMRDVGVDVDAMAASSSSVLTMTETTLDTGHGPVTTREVVRDGVRVAQPDPVASAVQFLPDLFAEPLDEAPAPSPTLAEPPAPPPELAVAASTGDPVPLQELLALEDRSLSSSDQKARVASLLGRPCALEVEVERVSMTLGLDVPAAFEDGQTVVATPAGERGPRLSVRFAPKHTERVQGLGYGDRLEVAGVLVSWDEFYRQAVVDVG